MYRELLVGLLLGVAKKMGVNIPCHECGKV